MPPDELVQRLDLFRIDTSKIRKTPEGGIIVRGRISRTGILEYTNADGSTRRELRLPEDVFSPDALASFDHATITDLHPTGLVTPLNWRQVAAGHLGGIPVQDGEFAEADLHIKHADTVRGVEDGSRSELSCGYQCRLDARPGTHPKYGRYDARQYGHDGNHVAIGPPGWGRSGSSVSIRADGFAGAVANGDADAPPYVRDMPPEKPATETNTQTPPVVKEDSVLRGENLALQKENERLRAEAKERTDAQVAGESQERTDAAIEARVALIDAAKPHLDSKDKPWSHKGKSDDAIRREVLAKLEPSILDEPEAKGDGADDFLRGAFNVAVKRADRATTALRHSLRASPGGGRADARLPTRAEKKDAATEGSGDLIADAADTQLAKTKDRWKPKTDRRGAR